MSLKLLETAFTIEDCANALLISEEGGGQDGSGGCSTFFFKKVVEADALSWEGRLGRVPDATRGPENVNLVGGRPLGRGGGTME